MEEQFVRYGELGRIFDFLCLGVLILTPDRRVAAMNASAEMLSGHREADLLGKFCYLHFKDYLCGGVCKYLETRQELRRAVVRAVEMYDENRGRSSLTKIEAPLHDAKGEIVGCIEIFQDQTAFRSLIQRIRFEDTKLKVILDNLDLGVLTADRSHHITFFNKMAETITGFSRADLLGKPASQVFDADLVNELLEARNNRRQEGFRRRLETMVRTASGQGLPAGLQYMSMKNESGRFVGGLLTFTGLSLRRRFDQVLRDRYTYHDMVGKDPAMRQLFDIIPVVAANNATVLINGDTGTGKDLLARIIHNVSPRAKRPFVKVNCASLPDNLLESELFGYVKGAFTGADKNKSGRFAEADGGSIFLDEIGDMPLALQAKLLRVLEDKEFYPLGSEHTTKVDVRIISATNQNLEKLVREKRFREDLFYRIKVLHLELPPLRERKGDLPLLIPHILKRVALHNDLSAPRVSPAAMELLLNYDYPGNVRELENTLEHCLIICRGGEIEPCHFPVSIRKRAQARRRNGEESPEADAETGERAAIIRTLQECEGNKTLTARALHMDRTTLWRKMKKYEIDDEVLDIEGGPSSQTGGGEP
ncbi:MAG: sigma 54-interacting transcriptional regulator [Desulfococcaceae bacterium]